MNYFAPLDAWLDEQLDESEIGWDEASVWTPAGFENFPEEAQPSATTDPSSKKIFTGIKKAIVSKFEIFEFRNNLT